MTWTPMNNLQLCSQNSSLPACSTSAMTFVSFLVQYFGQSNDNYVPSNDDEREEYDFIIVGAGSAGCVLANRLSEISHWRILLLEAGSDEPLAPDVPAFGSFLHGSSIDWSYQTTPEKNSCLAKPGGSCQWARGKVMGGSSTINYLMYIRGHKEDYDNWARMGNPGWTYKEVLPYFLKSEDNRTPEIVEANPEYHNTGGYATVEYFPYTDPNSNIIIDAWKELGYKNIDYNAQEYIGTLRYQVTAKNGQRWSTNAAFIRSVINNRSNIVVKSEAYVTKILIDSQTKLAKGVEYVITSSSNSNPKKAYAKKEVIVSAGSINSPKLLMLSGIGPKKELEKLGINVIQDLSVGKNLHDHVTIDGLMGRINSKKLQTLVGFDQMINDSLNYLKSQDNILSAMGTLSAGAFHKTKYESVPDYPDMQYTFNGVNVENYVEICESTPGQAVVPVSYYNGLSIRPVMIAPRSKGYLLLNETDPTWGYPYLYPNYFGDPTDLDILVAGIHESIKLFNTSIFKENGYELIEEPLPACKQYSFNSDDYWRCVSMSYTNTIYHFVGTCKMGPRTDPDAVVDAELKVHGLHSLRVVDSSIMPNVTRGNTNAPTVMIAEKISDAIKKNVTTLIMKKYEQAQNLFMK